MGYVLKSDLNLDLRCSLHQDPGSAHGIAHSNAIQRTDSAVCAVCVLRDARH